MNNTENKWCFLDRDGVLVKDKEHIHKIDDVEILPNAVDGLKSLMELGFRFVIVTNQAGIAKKYFTHEDAHKFNEELSVRLASAGIKIEKIYMCAHHPKHTGPCACRKPNTGMAEQAAKDFSIHPSRAIFVGDKDSDIEMGKRWGAKTFRIINEQYPEIVTADYRVKDLLQVAKIAEILNPKS